MTIDRRQFLYGLGATAVAGAVAAQTLRTGSDDPSSTDEWASVRESFALDPCYTHLALFYLASHPRPVREAIDEYRRALDANPLLTVEHNMFDFAGGETLPQKNCRVIAEYIGGRPEEVALVSSTTMGLGLVYNGLDFRRGDDILTTEHDHFVHHESIRLAAERGGATWRKVPLFDSYDSISADEIVERLQRAIRPNTRVLGVTWVHSSSGLKLPVRHIASMVAEVNRGREPGDRLLLVVDGVHGIGSELPDIAAMGADFFVAGTHKWIFGPRGTGFIHAPAENWALIRPTIASFTSQQTYMGWINDEPVEGPTRADAVSPGGFHSFEHYWAVPAAIEFHRSIGPARITKRIHELNDRVKEGLAAMPHVKVRTPMGSDLSSGVTCFDVEGREGNDIVAKLQAKKILITTTPYRVEHCRVAPGIANDEGDVDRFLAAVRAEA